MNWTVFYKTFARWATRRKNPPRQIVGRTCNAMSEPNRLHLLKSRDDISAVYLDGFDSSAGFTLQLSEGSTCSWAAAGDELGPNELRPRIEPWLSALVQSEHLSLLIGSGLTHGVHMIAKNELLPGMQQTEFGIFDAEISAGARIVAEGAERGAGNFEDQVRVANELLRGLEIALLADTFSGSLDETHILALQKGLAKAIEAFAASVLDSERSLSSAPLNDREQALSYLVRFLMSFASRTGTRERPHIFTTNYDRYIETGADAAGLRLIDRFVGALAPVFRASRLDVDMHYNPPGIRGEPRYLEGVARFSKLHGSIDWVDVDGAIRRIALPFGAQDVAPYVADARGEHDEALRLMVYPNSAKDRETAFYPYVELFRDFATSVCRPNNTLICYGYAFGDDHINRVITDMLTIPSTHLVVISYNDPLGKIKELADRFSTSSQLTLIVGNHLGDLRTLVDYYLPRPAVDYATVRMTKLLDSQSNATREFKGADHSSNQREATT